MIRLIHFSDIHLTVRPLGWSWRDCFNKRVFGWLNVHMLGRGRRFAQAPRIVQRLRDEILARQPEGVIFSGDASHFGFAAEISEAAAELGLQAGAGLPPGVAVPGNHDYYVGPAATSGAFERFFAVWQQGVRLENRPYPFAVRLGPLWLIAVQAAHPHVAVWDASGRIGNSQLQDVQRLCRQLEGGTRVVVCHYPLLAEDRQPEPWHRRLRDWAAACQTVRHCGIALWLHGHRHRWYWLAADQNLPCPTIGAGSATQSGRAGYLEYTFYETHLSVLRRVYDPDTDRYRDAEHFQLALPTAVTPSV
ncbi:MAG: metallophosphoesterase [Gemmataceae bacterium]|nr:metallophosphoesterase [Gemmataceae bacterium]